MTADDDGVDWLDWVDIEMVTISAGPAAGMQIVVEADGDLLFPGVLTIETPCGVAVYCARVRNGVLTYVLGNPPATIL